METATGLPEQNGQYAITVRNAQFEYRDVLGALISGGTPTPNVVLKDFNMSVKKGHIYSLLGASGCGKTSILRAIVGQLHLTAGEIRIFGYAPSSPKSGVPGTTVGYMPQELALAEEFTIGEILYFYGQLAGMASKDIHAKSDYLVKLLDLPKPNRIIETLSGGQQRRVSFAIALLHSPPILVLDEPTVGVDPLLRESIWEYMIKVTQTESTTVVITTHYTSEACKADTVGLMRHGKLMAEQSAQSLMEVLQCNDLGDILMRLCVLQSTKDMPISSVNDTIELPVLPKVNDDIENTEISSWVKKEVSPIKRIRVLGWKTAVSLRRHYWFIFLVHLFPTLCVIAFGVSYGRTLHGLKISIINQETNCFPSGLITPIPYKNENRTDCETPNFLSCRILETLQKRDILPMAPESPDSAESDVRRGRAWAVIMFPKNFTSALMQRARYASPHDAEDHVIDTGSMKVTMDESDRIRSFLLKEQLYLSLKQALADVTTECNTFRHMKDIPMQFKTPIYGGTQTGYLDTAMPGVAVGTVWMMCLTITVSVLLPDKIRGSLERGLIAGATIGEVLLSQFVVCLLPALNVILLTFFFGYFIFGLVMNGSFWNVAIIMVPIAVSGMLVGFILALLCNSFTTASLLGTGLHFTSIFSSGTIWPVEAIFPVLREICWILPITFSADAVRHIAVRGWSWNHFSLHLALVSTFLWSAVFLVSLFLILRFKILQ